MWFTLDGRHGKSLTKWPAHPGRTRMEVHEEGNRRLLVAFVVVFLGGLTLLYWGVWGLMELVP